MGLGSLGFELGWLKASHLVLSFSVVFSDTGCGALVVPSYASK